MLSAHNRPPHPSLGAGLSDNHAGSVEAAPILQSPDVAAPATASRFLGMTALVSVGGQLDTAEPHDPFNLTTARAAEDFNAGFSVSWSADNFTLTLGVLEARAPASRSFRCRCCPPPPHLRTNTHTYDPTLSHH